MEKIPYILSEAANLSAVSAPLKRSSRIKYTCFSVSQNYLILGASSGGLYIFEREPCVFIQLLPSTNGSVNLVSISPCESLVVFSTVKGSVSIVGFQSTSAPRFKRTSHEHAGTTITALQWSARSSEVYIGDNTGRISVISLLFYMGQSMFQLSHVTLMQLDSRIIQMDWHQHLLLVSTLSRSYLCDTVHEQFRQIGSQLRDGPFGACFHNVGEEDYSVVTDVERETTRYLTPFSSLREGERLLADDRLRSVKIFCARPGLRLWEVRIDGTVLNTLQLKRAVAVPSTPVVEIHDTTLEINAALSGTSQSFNFSTLCRAVDDRFLLAYHSDGFYLLDPGMNDVVVWSDSISGITDVKTVGDMIYLWCSDRRLHAVNVCELDSLVVRLYRQNKFSVCATLIADQRNNLEAMLTASPKLQFLPDLEKKIKENNIDVAEKVLTALGSMALSQSSHNQEKLTALKLDSGIFLVGNDFSLNCNEIQPKGQTYSYRDALLRKQTDVRNGVSFSNNDNFSLKVENETRNSSRGSSDVESSADDLDDIFQLLGITRQEMKIALKEMGNTITGTLSNSTNSVKKSLRVIMSKQKRVWASNYWNNSSPGCEEEGDLSTSSDCRRKKSLEDWKETPNTRINNFIDACENVSNYKSSDGKRLEEYIFDLMDSMVFLCCQYGSLSTREVSDVMLRRRNEPAFENITVSEIFSEWLKGETIKDFVFSQFFSEDVTTQIRIHLHNSLKSGMLVSWIRRNLPSVSENAPLFPSFMRNLYNEDEFLIDRVLSEFLKIMSSLIDPFIILQCLSVCESRCVYLSWNRIMVLCQQGKLHKDRNKLEGAEDDWPLPVTLNAILIMLDLKQVEYCNSAPVKDIFYTILRLEARGLKNGKSESVVFEECGSLFMEYLSALPPSKVNQCLDDIEIRTYLLTHFEQMNCFRNEIDCCPCGFPLPFVNDELSTYKLPHPKVCRSLIVWLNNNDREKLDDLTRSNPLLWPLILSVKRTDPLESILPIIVQMGDFLELEYRLEEITNDIWISIFKLCSDLGESACLGCSRPFKICLKTSDEIGKLDHWRKLWRRLAELIIRKIGPAEGTRLLSKHLDLVPRGTIDESFMKLCAISTLFDPTSGNLSRCVLDSILNDSRKIPNISALSRAVVENLKESGISTDMLPSSVLKPSTNHHWGIKLNLEYTTCPCCLLSLGSAVIAEKGGVAVFKCAHAFHTVCLQKRSVSLKKSGCPLCPKKNSDPSRIKP